MNSRLIFWSLTSALAGFLFGFDTVVISGVEQTIEKLWTLSLQQHGIAISIALWGTVLGSFVGGWPTDRWGRRKTLLLIGMLYFVSAIWSALANDVTSFMIARFIGGLGVGISTVAAPLYISEISPPEMRGRLAGMFQFNIVFGILVALLSNYLIGKSMSENAWRWMLGVEAIPAVLYTLMCFSLPRSPRWLIAKKGDRPAAEEVLRQIYAGDESQVQFTADEIEHAAQADAAVADGADRFWSKRLRIPIVMALLVAFFNQLSGINAILYFAPRIFELAGFGKNAALLNSVGIGVTNLIFTFVGLYLIDRLGRRTLLYIGSFGYIASLGLCAWAFFTYAAPFQVANSAITVANDSAALERVQSLGGTNENDVAALTANLAASKEKLAEAIAAEGYQGPKEILPTGETDAKLIEEIVNGVIEEAGEQSGSGGTLVMLSIFAFIAAHAVGQGAVIWVLISEIFPNRHRATGQALGSFTHWIFAALLTSVFPWMIGTFAPGYVFGFFCFMMILQLLWVATMVIETKGVPLEEMQQRLGIE